MLQHAQVANDRLRKFSRKALHWTQHTVLTSAWRSVASSPRNLDKVYAAVGKVFASSNVTGMKLEAFKYYY